MIPLRPIYQYKLKCHREVKKRLSCTSMGNLVNHYDYCTQQGPYGIERFFTQSAVSQKSSQVQRCKFKLSYTFQYFNAITPIDNEIIRVENFQTVRKIVQASIRTEDFTYRANALPTEQLQQLWWTQFTQSFGTIVKLVSHFT